jgi:hypothetical protein
MDRRVAVHLRCRRLKNFGFYSLGEAQHVNRAVNAGLGCLHGVELVMNRRGRTGEIVYLIYLHIEGKTNVVSHQFEMRPTEQMEYVGPGARVEIVDAKNFVPLCQKAFAQVGADESGASSNEHTRRITNFTLHDSFLAAHGPRYKPVNLAVAPLAQASIMVHKGFLLPFRFNGILSHLQVFVWIAFLANIWHWVVL